MDDEKTFWWMLQLQLPAKNENQLQLFSSPIPRQDLIRKVFTLIPKSIRIYKGEYVWGLADLNIQTDDVYTFKLTVRPPNAKIAEEPEPGHLEETKDPRFYTVCVLHIPLQIIVVHRSSYVSRYAKSAKTFAAIFAELVKDSINSLDMEPHYGVEVDPIAQMGSFIEWMSSIDKLKKITVKHAGPNLPAGSSSIVTSIRETANKYRNVLHSRDVEMSANYPKLDETEVEELDEAAAERKLKFRAQGVRGGVGTSWSSKTKPIPETAIMPINEDQLSESKLVSQSIKIYIENRFSRDQIHE
ncbi:hypothetical protein C4565_09920 [Candidatus Parcubacteria bacterium]|nr:MAG: hypothetical protein C4565_09920 [Candidatus Parcubacteria bacterium]